MASLIGAGNHGQDLCVIWDRVHPDNPLTVYDDDPETGNLAPPDDLTGRILIGVNDSHLRRNIAERYPHLRGCHPLVDPTAMIGPNVSLGRGSVVACNASLMHSVTLGNHSHVNYQASMTRCIVGDYSTISPGAVICGNVMIGEECTIGASATICERTSIGHGVVIGAGAIVPPYSVIPDGERVIGVWKNA